MSDDVEDGPLIVVTDTDAGVRELRGLVRVQPVLQRDEAASRAFQSMVTPHAFAIAGDGVIVSSTVPGSVGDLSGLLAAAREGRPATIARA